MRVNGLFHGSPGSAAETEEYPSAPPFGHGSRGLNAENSMTKEMVISANRHETKVAVLEDDQLVEVYFQRANEYSLAGSIHKGRVTRVLPGMQSAFVDLGLERDTFLYVSDFFEENEDFDRVAVSRESRPTDRGRGAPAEARPPETTAGPAGAENAAAEGADEIS